ncbi:hypothetical protein [Tessaracoccus flavus]|nr:hypothetical protein [Tessaracoccus flavus]SDY98895.1 hypothetical protein SAMN05428934_107133 [Tessaracoccus flavus]
MSDADQSELIRLAIALPDGLSTVERASWAVRGLAEIALFNIALDRESDEIDMAVAELGDLVRFADPRFADRLVQIRALIDSPPSKYMSIGSDWTPDSPSATPDKSLRAFCRIADAIFEGSDGPQHGPPVSAADGSAKTAMLERDWWRPASKPTHGVNFVPTSVPPSLTWKVWTYSAEPTVIIVDEKLTVPMGDIWWGVHNATHLDQIKHVADAGRNPNEIEYGEGLLAAESLAMTVEMLAGLEGRGTPAARVVWEGLAERLARMPIPSELSSPTVVQARQLADPEFGALPTLASAYTTGAIRLLESRFEHELIPPTLRESMLVRWRRLVDAEPWLRREIGSMR